MKDMCLKYQQKKIGLKKINVIKVLEDPLVKNVKELSSALFLENYSSS